MVIASLVFSFGVAISRRLIRVSLLLFRFLINTFRNDNAEVFFLRVIFAFFLFLFLLGATRGSVSPYSRLRHSGMTGQRVIAVTEKATLWSDRKKKGDDKGALFPYTEGRFLPQCFFLLSLIFCFFVLGGYKGGLFLPLIEGSFYYFFTKFGDNRLDSFLR